MEEKKVKITLEKSNHQKCMEIAERLYELDGEVYRCVGSTLGRTFTGNRRTTIKNLAMLMYTRPDGHLLRSEMALISNMARTIKDKEVKSRLMREYNEILKQVETLDTAFGKVDILDEERARLNTANLRQEFTEDDHLIICIGRTHGSAGNDIGFALADALKINYYDVEIFNQVLSRLEAEKGSVNDDEKGVIGEEFNKYRSNRSFNLKKSLKELSRYHGLPRKDAVFFNQSDLICSMARTEDFIVMGRCADVILKNNHIPHISIFINAPFELRVHRVMEVNNMTMKQAIRFLKTMDKRHERYYNYFTGDKWGAAENYDLCINSSSYGIDETVELIERMIAQHPKRRNK